MILLNTPKLRHLQGFTVDVTMCDRKIHPRYDIESLVNSPNECNCVDCLGAVVKTLNAKIQALKEIARAKEEARGSKQSESLD